MTGRQMGLLVLATLTLWSVGQTGATGTRDLDWMDWFNVWNIFNSRKPESSKCHSCHSGGYLQYQFKTCPADGELNGWAENHVVECTGPCVTVVQRYPLGNVLRGCSTWMYIPGDTPTSGCVTIGQDQMCFCEGDRCNSDDMLEERAQLMIDVEGDHWDYSHPELWGWFFPVCSPTPTSQQSPILLDSSSATQVTMETADKFVFQGYGSDLVTTLVNNGHTAKVALSEDDVLSVSGGGLQGTYRALQLHFHWGQDDSQGSEHLWRENSVTSAFPLEMHIVHVNDQMEVSDALQDPLGLAVLGVMFVIQQDDNPDLQPIIDHLHDVHTADSQVTLPVIVLDSLLPGNRDSFYRYQGSLTTPGCFEVVTWTVFTETVGVSASQMEEFRKLGTADHGNIVDNFRPLQPINGRVVNLYTS